MVVREVADELLVFFGDESSPIMVLSLSPSLCLKLVPQGSAWALGFALSLALGVWKSRIFEDKNRV